MILYRLPAGLALCCYVSLMASTITTCAVAAERPNVLIFFSDDLGYSDLGCYGGEIETPNLNRLAAEGLRFTQFYNTARCWPSRAALLTGYYAQQVRRDTLPGIPSGGRGVRPPWAPLLPEMLRPYGYHSYHSGKWHLDGARLAGGFDHSYSLEDQNRFFNPHNQLEDDKPLPPIAKGSGFYATTHIADHAIQCLKGHAEKHADTPFFSYVAFTSPHFPLQAPAQDVAKYRDRYRAGWNEIRAARHLRQLEMGLLEGDASKPELDVGPPYHFPDAFEKLGPGEVNRPLPWNSLTAEQREFQAAKMAVHAAMIDRMDQEIGRVLEQVAAMGAAENTLVMFLSDNGASAEIMVRGDGHDPSAPAGSAESYLCLGPGWSTVANTPFRRHKTWVHEGGISTPFIVKWPRGIAARGEFRRAAAHIVDVVPTVLELAVAGNPIDAAKNPAPAKPGLSLVEEFSKPGSLQHPDIWWMHEGNRAIRVGDWKLVAAGDKAPWELYDLKTDRIEAHNLATVHPEKVEELAKLWSQRTDEIRLLALDGLPDERPLQRPLKK